MATFETTTSRDFLGTLTVNRDGAVATDADDTEHDAILVPIENQRLLEKKFAKLARKAQRLGFDAPVLTHVGDVVETRKVRNEGGHLETFVLRYGAYTLVAAPVHFTGWHFVASIQHLATDDGEPINLISKAPAFEGEQLSVELRKALPVCEHCNTARRRNDTFVIRHDDSRQLQVGRQCIQDYLGEADGSRILALASYLRELRSFSEDDWSEGNGSGVLGWPTATFLKVSVASVNYRGFVSRGSTRENGGLATADHVVQTLVAIAKNDAKSLRNLWDNEYFGSRGSVYWTTADLEKAEQIIEWTQDGIADDTDSDYLWNLKVAAGLSSVTWKQAGIVASAVTAYDRHLNGERRKAEQAKAAETSSYIGKAGDKIGRKLSAADKRKGASAFPALTVTVSFTRSFETEWGTTTLVSFTDTDGNVLTWFASNGAYDTDGEQVEEGKSYSLVGTIKGHKDYNGTAQTSVNRCKLSPIQTEGDDDDDREEAPVEEPTVQAERDAKEAVEAAQQAAAEIITESQVEAVTDAEQAEITLEQLEDALERRRRGFEDSILIRITGKTWENLGHERALQITNEHADTIKEYRRTLNRTVSPYRKLLASVASS